MMRLDKFLSVTGTASRKEAALFIKKGLVSVGGVTVNKTDLKIDENRDEITLKGEKILYKEHLYILLNKPEGYISATEDGKEPTVLELVPEKYRKNLFPCGRLDKNTVGLMLLTDDGPLGHRLLSPKHHVTKTYAFSVKFNLSNEDLSSLEKGVDIGGYITAPCKVVLHDRRNGEISITEGKYHQIKLMMKSVHNQITFLERIRFGNLTLDDHLERGMWRFLTEEEESLLKKQDED